MNVETLAFGVSFINTYLILGYLPISRFELCLEVLVYRNAEYNRADICHSRSIQKQNKTFGFSSLTSGDSNLSKIPIKTQA